jgi:hypothetical protein
VSNPKVNVGIKFTDGKILGSGVVSSIKANGLFQNVTPLTFAQFVSDEENDFAVINVAQDLRNYGQFELQSGFSSGTVNITGYPASIANGLNSAPLVQQDSIGQATSLAGSFLFREDTVQSGGVGASGAPLWRYDGSHLTAVGSVAGQFQGTNYDVQFSPGDIGLIKQWTGNKVVEGYISGATVFADANGNGQLDAGEASTTTDSTGGFSLTGGSGPLVAFGGTDTSTGLQFKASSQHRQARLSSRP